MSESTAEATTTETTTETTETAATEAPVTLADVEKWKALARKHEDRAKANSGAAKELEELRKASMTEQEKAVAAAVAEARTATLREVGAQLVAAEFRAQAAGRLTAEQVAELIEDLDMAKYLTDTGEVDSERVTRKVEALAPQPTEQTAPTWPDLGQGSRDQNLALNGDPLERALKDKLGIR